MPIKDRKRAPAALPHGARAKITVGIHGAEGDAMHAEATFAEDGALEPSSELTVAEVGSFHEFGTSTIPQRSFIRAWFDESVAENRELLNSQLKLAIAGKLTLEAALERCALKFEASVRKRIRARIPPPLAQSTIDRKGSTTPLIDTGQLVSSIRGKAEVLRGGTGGGT